MGADLAFENPREEGGEPVADLAWCRIRRCGRRGAAERAPR
jgi:hypothetical protein